LGKGGCSEEKKKVPPKTKKIREVVWEKNKKKEGNKKEGKEREKTLHNGNGQGVHQPPPSTGKATKRGETQGARKKGLS